MADQQVTPPVTSPVTSPTPVTKQKNPKRVAAGKAIAARTKLAREAQKKALIEAQSIIAKKTDPQPADPQPANPQPADPQPADPQAENVLSTTQWLSVISIVVSLAGIYYKREEIKGRLRITLCRPRLLTQEKRASKIWIRLPFFVNIPCRNLTLSVLHSKPPPSVELFMCGQNSQ